MAEATGRTAVVTGAASGIGFAVADRLLREGARVVAVDRERRGMQPLVDRGADAVEGDLTVDADRDRVVAAGQGAHYLVNAAGIIRLKPIWDITITDLREVYAVNVEATWDLCSRIGRTIPGGGAIVNLSSSSAKLANRKPSRSGTGRPSRSQVLRFPITRIIETSASLPPAVSATGAAEATVQAPLALRLRPVVCNEP